MLCTQQQFLLSELINANRNCLPLEICEVRSGIQLPKRCFGGQGSPAWAPGAAEDPVGSAGAEGMAVGALCVGHLQAAGDGNPRDGMKIPVVGIVKEAAFKPTSVFKMRNARRWGGGRSCS